MMLNYSHIQKPNQGHDNLFKQATLLYKQKNYQSSLIKFQSALKEDPINYNLLINISSTQIKLKQCEQSLSSILKAIKLRPYQSIGYYQRSSVYIKQRKFTQAYNQLKCALSCELLKQYHFQGNLQILSEALILSKNNLEAKILRIIHLRVQLMTIRKLNSFQLKTDLETLLKKQIQQYEESLLSINQVVMPQNQLTMNPKRFQYKNCLKSQIKDFQLQSDDHHSQYVLLNTTQQLNLIKQIKQIKQRYQQLFHKNSQRNYSLIFDISHEKEQNNQQLHCVFEQKIQQIFVQNIKQNQSGSISFLQDIPTIKITNISRNQPMIREKSQKSPQTLKSRMKYSKYNKHQNKQNYIQQNIKNIKKLKANKQNALICKNDTINKNKKQALTSKKGILKTRQQKRSNKKMQQSMMGKSIISILDYDNSTHNQQQKPSFKVSRQLVKMNTQQQFDCNNCQNIQQSVYQEQFQSVDVFSSKKQQKYSLNKSFEDIGFNRFSRTKNLKKSMYLSANNDSFNHLSCSKCSIDKQNEISLQKDALLKIQLTEIDYWKNNINMLKPYCIVKVSNKNTKNDIEQQYQDVIVTEKSKGKFPNWDEPIQLNIKSINNQEELQHKQIEIEIWSNQNKREQYCIGTCKFEAKQTLGRKKLMFNKGNVKNTAYMFVQLSSKKK